MKTENVLIIGASSKAAVNLTRLLSSEEKYQLYGISSKFKIKNPHAKIINYQDLAILQRIKFSRVIVMASLLPHQSNSLSDFIQINDKIKMTLERLCFANHNSSIIFLSSFDIYDKTTPSIDLSTPLNLTGPYSRSKFEMECFISGFALANRMSHLIARLPIFLYEGGRTNLINRLGHQAFNQGNFSLYNKESSMGGVFDVEGLAKLIPLNIPIKTHNAVNCGAIPDITFFEIGELAKKYGLKNILWRRSKVKNPTVDLESLRSVGFEPQSSRQIIEHWFRNEHLKLES